MNRQNKTKLEYRTIFLSDTHLGMRETGIKKLNHFLAHVRCKALVLNGDFIDGWALVSPGKPEQAVKLAKEAGAEVVSFVRIEVGEGIEKDETDFAAEVAAQLKG